MEGAKEDLVQSVVVMRHGDRVLCCISTLTHTITAQAMEGAKGDLVQNVVVMRHGDRVDHLRPEWVYDAKRPWDPPLHEEGMARAWNTGKKLRDIGFPIHRVIVSPFLRCRQTAARVLSALCATEGTVESSDGVVIDPSSVQVSIEYGLCEIIGRPAIYPDVIPKDGIWFHDISELQSSFPHGTVDRSAVCIYETNPCWEESMQDARKRFAQVIQALADKYPHENLLLVTHGECVSVSVRSFLEGAQVTEVQYCGFSHLERRVGEEQCGGAAGGFKLCDQNGVSFFTPI